jgi:hypothetical protein
LLDLILIKVIGSIVLLDLILIKVIGSIVFSKAASCDPACGGATSHVYFPE